MNLNVLFPDVHVQVCTNCVSFTLINLNLP